MRQADVDVVVPTIGRPSLEGLLESLTAAGVPQRVLLVDDRRPSDDTAMLPVPESLRERVTILSSGGRGPAAARNTGWRASGAQWIAFLDDDVLVTPEWTEALLADLDGLSNSVAASQGRILVHVPSQPRLTDWERNVKRLEGARWITADMAFRRQALQAVGGFDERFPRAFREDSDLALRLMAAGWHLVEGRRTSIHPVRPADRWVSIRSQAGNADDALMTALHGRSWRRVLGEPRGRLYAHLGIVAAGLLGLSGWALARRRLALSGALAWLVGTAEFSWARLRGGRRDAREMATVTVTSAAIPPAATFHWIRGLFRAYRLIGPRAAEAGIPANEGRPGAAKRPREDLPSLPPAPP